jgi:hypothetical protein
VEAGALARPRAQRAYSRHEDGGFAAGAGETPAATVLTTVYLGFWKL